MFLKLASSIFLFFLLLFFFFATPHGIYGSHRVGHNWCDLAAAAAWHVKLPWPGIELSPPSVEGKVLATGPQGSSYMFLKYLFIFLIERYEKKQVVITHCCCCLVSFNSLQPHGLWPAKLLCLWNSPGKNTGVGCHCLLQGIFMTQGSNPCLL